MKKSRWVSLFVFAFLAGCGGGGGGGGSPSPPVVNVPSATVFYPYNNMLAGGLMTVEADVYDGSGISRVELLVNGATAATSYSGHNGGYNMDFNADGLATGNHLITVRAWNLNGVMGESLPVTVRVDADNLRRQALQYLRDYNAQLSPTGAVGGVRRWASLPITIESSSEISLVEVLDAANFWTKYSSISFRVIAGSVTAVNPQTGKTGVVFVGYGTPFLGQSLADVWLRSNGFIYEAGIITIRKGALNKYVLVHEIGHTIGFLGHTKNGTLMDGNIVNLRMDATVVKAMKILYFELYPGAPVPVI